MYLELFTFLCSYIFLTALLEYNCFTMLCQFLLYNKVNQLYVYIYPHIPSFLHIPPTLLIPPLQVVRSTQRISLFYEAASHKLSILHWVVYICQCYSLTSSQLTLPPLRVLKSILYVCVFIPVLPLGFSEPYLYFLVSIYMCQHTVFVFLRLTYFTQYDNLQVHPYCCKWHYFILFYGWVIFYCIYVPHFLYPLIH